MNRKKIIIVFCLIIAIIIAVVFYYGITSKKTQTYNVEFETNGGSYIASQVIPEGEKVDKPDDPKKDGYIFLEWEHDGETYDFSMGVSSDMTLYAKWIEKDEDIESYVVKFNSDGGTTIANQVIKKGEKIEKPSDPKKDGYTFVGWFLDETLFDFNNIINKDLGLKAKWEENKQNIQNNSNDKVNTNTGNSNNNNQPKPSESIVNLAVPSITRGGHGGTADGTYGMELNINSTAGITGIEIYSSTTESGTYSLLKSVKKEDWNSTTSTVQVQKGQHLYFKVRTYVTNASGTFYSAYSNILDLDNSLKKPTITRGGVGGTADGTYGMELSINSTDAITGIEIYSSTTENGTYSLLKSVKKEDWNSASSTVQVQKGQHLYFKVRTYVTNSAGTFYSAFSNTLDLDNSLKTPTLTRGGFGVADGIYGMELSIDSTDKITGIEIYSSTSLNSGYNLLRTVKKEEWNSTTSNVQAQKGEHLYFKVRTYVTNSAGTFYSDFSNVLELDNSN